MGFPSLRQIPQIYADEWEGWDDFFQNTHNSLQDSQTTLLNKQKLEYITYHSFITLMRVEGIDNAENYRNWYNEDNRKLFKVPEHPEEIYPELQHWKEELQERTAELQESPEEPQERTAELQESPEELQERTAELQESPEEPQERTAELQESPEKPQERTAELQESPSQSVQKPNQAETINSSRAGHRKKRAKPSRQRRQYPPFKDLQQQVQALGFKTSREYRIRRHEIPNSPSHPDQFYEEWKSWPDFLGTRQYPPFTNLQQQVQALGFKTSREYQIRRREIPNSPSHPEDVYEEWESWPDFLGTRQYPPFKDLQQQVQALGFKTSREYRIRRHEIPNSPALPDQVYEEWEDWYAFLGTSPKQFLSFTNLQQQVHALGIKSMTEYKKRHHEIPNSPSHPEDVYEEWEDWRQFFSIEACKKHLR